MAGHAPAFLCRGCGGPRPGSTTCCDGLSCRAGQGDGQEGSAGPGHACLCYAEDGFGYCCQFICHVQIICVFCLLPIAQSSREEEKTAAKTDPPKVNRKTKDSQKLAV